MGEDEGGGDYDSEFQDLLSLPPSPQPSPAKGEGGFRRDTNLKCVGRANDVTLKNTPYLVKSIFGANFDGFVKSPKTPFPVIPATAGIQLFIGVIKPLDSGFHLSARHRQAGVTTFYEIIKFI